MSKSSTETANAEPNLHDASAGRSVGVEIRSAALMNGRREVVILHAGERYRLRITANDRLILTK